MSFFLTHLRLALRAQLGSWRGWVLLLLLPALTFGIKKAVPPRDAAAPVQVGVVLPEEGGEEFWARLEERQGLVTAFVRCDLDLAERRVAAGRWDCALVLPEDFEARLAKLDTYQLFTLLVGPGSAVYPMVRETAAAVVFELLSPEIAQDYLLSSGILAPEDVAQARPRLEETLLDQDRVLVSMETADGLPLDSLTLADSGLDSLLAGLTAIVLLVWALFTAMDLGRWLESPLARRLRPLRGTLALLLPRLLGALAPALCSGALALLALDRPAAYVPPLVPYLLFWGGLALVLARWRGAWNALPVLMPFAPAAGLLLSPVLLDLSALFPALGPVCRWMPVTLYLRACGGSGGDALILAAAGAGLIALLWGLERAGRARPA